MDAKYNPTAIEAKWYQYWQDKKLFHSTPDGREAYTVVIPPPNVTGVLHMGHVLNNTIQDILVRRARLEGKNACWAPGTDHASIATEAKVIKRLKEQGINKSDLTREEFLKHAWAWTEEHGGIILKQLRTLGCSCDWDRTAFTMDETRSKAVIDVFCDLYNKELRTKEVVNTQDGRKLGRVCDIVLCYPENKWLGIIAPNGRAFSSKKNGLFIELRNIVKIGEDVILVNVGAAEKPSGKRPCSPCEKGKNTERSSACPPPCPPPYPPNLKNPFDSGRSFEDYE